MQQPIVVLGGGLVGAAFAIACKHYNLPIVLIEKDSLENLLSFHDDGRTTAINLGSKKWLDNLGVWTKIAPFAEPIHYIRAFEHGSAHTLDYDYQDLGNEPLGYIVENGYIRKALWESITELKIEHLLNQKIKQLTAQTYEHNVLLENDQILKASLLVGADGKNSFVRKNANICQKTWEYDQIALVCHITHATPHNNTAWEVFTADGPLAVLPMTRCPKTGNYRSGIVFAKPRSNKWEKIFVTEIAKMINEIFPFYDFIHVNEPLWTYPLSAMTVDKVIDHRAVIIGDAAHTMHPIAGQGVNLGWRDAKILSQILNQHYKLGIDLGNEDILQIYQKQRIVDQKIFVKSTDWLHKIFMYDNLILSLGRQLSFTCLNNLPFVKKILMRRAMGIN